MIYLGNFAVFWILKVTGPKGTKGIQNKKLSSSSLFTTLLQL